jgi:hypothetical protein
MFDKLSRGKSSLIIRNELLIHDVALAQTSDGCIFYVNKASNNERICGVNYEVGHASDMWNAVKGIRTYCKAVEKAAEAHATHLNKVLIALQNF